MLNLKPLDLKKISPVDFPVDKYYPEIFEKTQTVLHHTVSGPGIRGDVNTWLNNSARIATCIIVDRNGTPYQCFGSKYWAHHLGVKSSFLKERGFDDYMYRNVELNRSSIAIEIDNWGGIVRKGNKFYNAYNGEVDPSDIIQYDKPFRGYSFFEKYTQKQIETVGELLLFWHDRYNISLKYNEDMWDVSNKALAGENGVWTHVSYRPDKSDCHPQPELISMLKEIATY